LLKAKLLTIKNRPARFCYLHKAFRKTKTEARNQGMKLVGEAMLEIIAETFATYFSKPSIID